MQTHEWVNFMSMLHSVTASLDVWTMVSALTSVYTCVHKEYVYLKGHVLWVPEPCNEGMKDMGFIFAAVSIFAGYNLITCFTQINLVSHYGKCHKERVVYVISALVAFNTSIIIIVGMQHLSMLAEYANHRIYDSIAFIYYIVVCLTGIFAASVRKYPFIVGLILAFFVLIDLVISFLFSAIAFSQLIAPKHGDYGHDGRLCRLFGDDEINEQQIGDLILFAILRMIQVFVNVILLVCISLIRSENRARKQTEGSYGKRAQNGDPLGRSDKVLDLMEEPFVQAPATSTMFKRSTLPRSRVRNV
ncbi:hypothetical protein CYMTET_44312 [Cymbomonas tetramitiformis]|uniref:Uncharacterized protein n=1 Tax=Cymbomonas tetramitiformis TaxID=36881 RepID=A0AAE0C0A4_9CHLO|nr:hypothetical protein CYMTET_44312 [Cymbomonas tetramitiformis]